MLTSCFYLSTLPQRDNATLVIGLLRPHVRTIILWNLAPLKGGVTLGLQRRL